MPHIISNRDMTYSEEIATHLSYLEEIVTHLICPSLQKAANDPRPGFGDHITFRHILNRNWVVSGKLHVTSGKLKHCYKLT